MRNRKSFAAFIFVLSLAISCKQEAKKEEEPAEAAGKSSTTPVTITSPLSGNMSDTVNLNATSQFMLKTYVKSSANGYLQLVNAALGKNVTRGEEIFIVKTKEAQSLGNIITSLDTSLHFDGAIHIKSPGTGYISQLNYRSGDYVQDGEQLATITDTRSFVFILSLPYELRQYLSLNQSLQLRLADGTVLNGSVSMAMPSVDSVSQTQKFVIRVNTDKSLPENLIAKVTLTKKSKNNTLSLPKAAVLSDETQQQFWIMQLIDSVTAVKVPVKKGLETSDRIEILSPALKTSDKILLTGNYGLSDTAKVSITQ